MTGPGAAAEARARAARVVTAVVDEHRYLDAALDEARTGPADQNALVQELAYGTLRWYHQLAGIAALFLKKKLAPKDGDIHALLLIGLYQLRSMRVAPHAAVSETVNATAVLDKPWAKGFVNACLRAARRESVRIEAAIAASPILKYSHPAWLIDELQRAYPADWERILVANNIRPPLTLRVNLARTTRAHYLERLAAADIEARALDITDSAIELAHPTPVERVPGFNEGLVSVQDGAAQLAAILLDAQPGARVLDACAAPGGKTAHILERCPGLTELTALDIDGARLGRVRTNLERLGLGTRLVEADAGDPGAWWDGRPYDRVLLDTPCSATGVIRRHPDIKVRRHPDEVAVLVAAQARLLEALWPCVRRGGKLLYTTCSILPAENEQQLHAFLARHADAEAPDEGRRRLRPGEQGSDGFFYACVHKH